MSSRTPTSSLFPSSGTSSPMSTVTPASTDEVDELIHTTWGDRPSLPTDEYPRTFPVRTVTRGYYAAMGVWYLASSVFPLSAVYLAWFFTVYQGQRNPRLAALAAAYATCEVAFAAYMAYTIRRVQRPSPPSNLSPDRRQELLRKIMTADLAADPRADMSGHKLQERMWEMFGSDAVPAGGEAGLDESGGMRTRSRTGARTRTRTRTHGAVREKDLSSEKKLKRDIEVQADHVLDQPVGHMEQLHHSHPRAVEFRERLRTWFHHAPWDSIKRDNVLEWLAWSCFNMEYTHCKADANRVTFLKNSIDMLEARTGTVFEQGYNRDIKIMRLTLDPVNAKARPLILYAFTNAVNWYLRTFVLTSYGMTYHKEGEMGYLVRIPPGWTPAKARSDNRSMPIVYMHGLGFGLLQSHLLIKSLVTKLDSHPILVPLAPYTAQSVFHHRHLRPWTQNEVVEGMTAICKRWGFWDGEKEGGVSMMSHSNGSVAHAWLLKRCPDMIKRNTFVDPVCFCLWEGDICFSFCYRKPKTALEVLLFYFIAAEVGIANYIQRHFDWADNNLFVDEIPALRDSSRTAFFFGGHDIIIDAARARRYLERHGVAEGLHWDERGGHGDGLAGESLSVVMTYVATGSVHC